MNNNNTLKFLDVNSIPLDDLPDEYKKLFQSYEQLKKINETDKQQIYELQRHLKTAKSIELHLSQELESITTLQNSEVDRVQLKYNQELDDCKRILSETKDYNNSLEQNIDDLNNENNKLKVKLEEISKTVQNEENTTVSNDNIEKEIKLEKENFELLAKLDEFQHNIQNSMMIIAERESKIEILKEQIQCLEENLLSKREELEEKTSSLEITQERMIEMNAELAMLKSAPEMSNRKGNSLFAEVDDQRQAMKQLLAAQKKSYLHMKKIYKESEHEIRRLKRENTAMHNELQACSSIFLHSDKTYKEKLNERIHLLLKGNTELEKKLKWTQDCLISLGIEKGINWLDSMLTFTKNETEELKAQLYTCRMQKALLDRNYYTSQQDYAKWRFEALKSRCIIIDRESLLDENNIKYKTFTSNDFQFSEKEMETAKPQISYGKRRSLIESLDKKTTNLTKNQQSQELLNKENELINTPKTEQSNKLSIFNGPPKQQHDQLDQKRKVSGNNFFEICEDSNTFMPSSSSTSLNIKTMSTGINMELGQNSENKLMLPINNTTTNENKYSTIIKKECTIVNSSSFDENIKNNNNSFEIYVDTTKNCFPLVKPQSNSVNCNEISVKNENKENISKDNGTVKKEFKQIDNIASLAQNNSFEIYEDTTKNCFPLMKPNNNNEKFNDIFLKNKNKENISEYNETVNIDDKCPILDNPNFFEIHQDTTNNCLRLTKPNNNDKNFNNKSLKNEFTNSLPNDENIHAIKNCKKSIQPISVKEKVILADNLKDVKFDEKTIKKEDKNTMKITTKRINANLVIKKIVFNSNNVKK